MAARSLQPRAAAGLGPLAKALVWIACISGGLVLAALVVTAFQVASLGDAALTEHLATQGQLLIAAFSAVVSAVAVGSAVYTAVWTRQVVEEMRMDRAVAGELRALDRSHTAARRVLDVVVDLQLGRHQGGDSHVLDAGKAAAVHYAIRRDAWEIADEAVRDRAVSLATAASAFSVGRGDRESVGVYLHLADHVRASLEHYLRGEKLPTWDLSFDVRGSFEAIESPLARPE